MMSSPPSQRLGLKARIKAMARGTIGRIPIVGPVSRKLWRKAKLWWHLPHQQEMVLSNLNTTSSGVTGHIDLRFAQSGQQLQQTQDFLVSLLVELKNSLHDVGVRQGWLNDSIHDMKLFMMNHQKQVLQELKSLIQGAGTEQTETIADSLGEMESELVRLRDHHATAWQRLTDQTRVLGSEVGLRLQSLQERIPSVETREGG